MNYLILNCILFFFTVSTPCFEDNSSKTEERNVFNYFVKFHDLDLRKYTGKLLIIPNSGCRYCYVYALRALNEERIKEDIIILVLGHREEAVKTRLYQNIFFGEVKNALSYRVSAFTLTLYEFNGQGEYYNFEVSAVNFHDIFDSNVLKE